MTTHFKLRALRIRTNVVCSIHDVVCTLDMRLDQPIVTSGKQEAAENILSRAVYG